MGLPEGLYRQLRKWFKNRFTLFTYIREDQESGEFYLDSRHFQLEEEGERNKIEGRKRIEREKKL